MWNRIAIKLKEVPKPVYNEALVRVTLTTICGTDLHILRGEYPVKAGLTIGHEPVGVIEELGPAITGYKTGERVLIGAITPVRPVRILPFRQMGPVRRPPRRLEIWEHDRWMSGRGCRLSCPMLKPTLRRFPIP